MSIEQVFHETQNVGVIYKFKSPSGKQYIGQAIEFQKRYSTYKRRKQNSIGKKFWHAIQKYDGIENFEIEILCKVARLECVSEFKKLLDKLEIFFIKYYDTYNSGYNSTQGGEGSLGRITKEETKRKIGEANKGGHAVDDISCTCTNCGNQFGIQPHEYRLRMKHSPLNNIFCTPKCYAIYRAKTAKIITYECGHCNKELTLPNHQYNAYMRASTTGKLFCNVKCFRAYKRQIAE